MLRLKQADVRLLRKEAAAARSGRIFAEKGNAQVTAQRKAMELPVMQSARLPQRFSH
jgi:hypothetical protein